MKLIWHYTHGQNFPDILKSGYVDIERLYVPSTEKAVAWFSSDQFWENTVRKGGTRFSGGYGMREMVAQGLSLYRIGVLPEAVPLNWTAIRMQSGMSAKMARGMIEVAKKWGANPLDWYGSFAPVPASQWQTVESFDGTKWIPYVAAMKATA